MRIRFLRETNCGERMTLSPSSKLIMDFKSTIYHKMFINISRKIYSRSSVVLFLLVGAFYWSLFYSSAHSFNFISSFSSTCSSSQVNSTARGAEIDLNLYNVLQNASTEDKTVIITNVNEAWAEQNSLLDLFMESIKTGNGTLKYLNHLVIVCVDQKAYDRCLTVHRHCYKLNTTQSADENGSSTEAYYMTESYLELVWKKVHLLKTVLELGFNFLFTDCDIMWLQDPFPRFFADRDIQTSCDSFKGNPYNHNNAANTGFHYVKSNERTIQFYKFWYSSRLVHRHKHDQEVFDTVRRHPYIDEIGLKFIFLDTKYFGGFCQSAKDVNVACTMHANCCFGLQNKISDLKLVLEDWRNYSSLPPSQRPRNPFKSPWRVPHNCSTKVYKPPKLSKKSG